MHILAISGDQGSGYERYIIAKEDDDASANPDVQVLDLEQGQLFAPVPLAMIMKHGYWEPYEGDQSILPKLLADVETGDADDEEDEDE